MCENVDDNPENENRMLLAGTRINAAAWRGASREIVPAL